MSRVPIGVGQAISEQVPTSIALGDGQRIGHVDISFWSGGPINTDRRAAALTARLMELLRDDVACQQILAEQDAAISHARRLKGLAENPS